MTTRAEWTLAPRSILPVKVGVNVSCCHQPKGCCPRLPSAQRDLRPTHDSSLYGPPEPLCYVNKQPYRIAEIKLSNQLTAAPLPKVKHFSWVNSDGSHWPTIREGRGTKFKAFKRILVALQAQTLVQQVSHRIWKVTK